MIKAGRARAVRCTVGAWVGGAPSGAASAASGCAGAADGSAAAALLSRLGLVLGSTTSSRTRSVFPAPTSPGVSDQVPAGRGRADSMGGEGRSS